MLWDRPGAWENCAVHETDNTPQTGICLFYYLSLQFARDEKFDLITQRPELNFAIWNFYHEYESVTDIANIMSIHKGDTNLYKVMKLFLFFLIYH